MARLRGDRPAAPRSAASTASPPSCGGSGRGSGMRSNTTAIKSAVKLSRVVADLTGEHPHQRSRELVVRCPFHDDKRPSLRINDEKNDGVWCCDPCGKGGDMFRFVMEHQGLSFLAALDFLVDRYGVEPYSATSEIEPW